jgi:thiamine biosynthesis protein ThiI
MPWPPILVRYGEIGIKSRQVRLHFERVLVERIEEQLLRRKVESEVKRDWGRIFVRAADVDAALDALAHTFGVVSASPARETDATPDAVAALVLDVARAEMPPDAGFAVRVKRSGQHAFTSLDVAKACAARILDDLAERRPHVDLDAPAFEAHAEVREGGAFVFQRTVRGPGGLPLGSQGRVGVLVDGPRAAHAAWLMAKRGSLPFFFAARDAPSAEWLAPLQPWVPDTRVRWVDGATRAGQLASLAPLLAQHRCQALVVADDLAQQLARFAEDKAAGVPVFRPLTGYAGARFEALDALVRS